MAKRGGQHTEPPLRRSARLEEKQRPTRSSAPISNQSIRREERSLVLPSPSTGGLAKENHYKVQLPRSSTNQSTNVTSSVSDLGKTPSYPFETSAGSKGEREKEPAHSAKRSRAGEPAEPSLEQREQLAENTPRTSDPTAKSSDRPEVELGVSAKTKESRCLDPISYWAEHGTWPDTFSKSGPMPSASNSRKRQRTSDVSQDDKDKRTRSYTQSRKDGDVPEQYTPQYQSHILKKGLDMDFLKGGTLVTEQSKKACTDLEKITQNIIQPTIVPHQNILAMLQLLGTRNEAMVNRDVTPMIVPPIIYLYFGGDNHLEHVVDEVNANWYAQCILEGPQMRPDLAIGLRSSAFTEAEIAKLKIYNSIDNWTEFTDKMYFPFLMCEVKCGDVGLNKADRQNMHSCSVAVRALLRLEQEADKYRSKKKLQDLNGHVLVFSISHDNGSARLFGHFAIVQEERWTYHRYHIGVYNILFRQQDLLLLNNFVRNVLKSHAAVIVERLQNALSAIPESSTLPVPSTTSVSASAMSVDDKSQQTETGKDADGYAIPALPPAALQRKMAEEKTRMDNLVEGHQNHGEQLEEIKKLLGQLVNEKENRENKERMEQQTEQ